MNAERLSSIRTNHNLTNRFVPRMRGTFFGALCLLLLGVAAPSEAEVVNINRADAAALEQNLKGIGPVKAKAIVDYRKKNGPFKKVDDIRNVEGIGDKIFSDNRRSLSLNRGATSASKSATKSTKSTSKSSSKSTAKSSGSSKTKAESKKAQSKAGNSKSSNKAQAARSTSKPKTKATTKTKSTKKTPSKKTASKKTTTKKTSSKKSTGKKTTKSKSKTTTQTN